MSTIRIVINTTKFINTYYIKHIYIGLAITQAVSAMQQRVPINIDKRFLMYCTVVIKNWGHHFKRRLNSNIHTSNLLRILYQKVFAYIDRLYYWKKKYTTSYTIYIDCAIFTFSLVLCFFRIQLDPN